MLKKLFALLVAVGMLITMTYIPAVAEDFNTKDILPDGWLEVEIDAAQIGNVTYKTLAIAIGAANDGDTIQLLRDTTEQGPFEIIGGSVTINGNGHTVTCEEGFVVNDGSLTLSADLSVVASVSAVLCVSGGEVISSANLKATGEFAAIEAAEGCTGSVTVKGGNVESDAENCIAWGNGGSLVITGGTFSSNPVAYCAPGYMVEENGEGKYEVKKNESVVAIDENGNEYEDLQAAIDEVSENGGKLTLAKDVIENVLNVLPGATVDLNGYTLTTDYITVYGGAYIVDGSAENTGLLKCDKDKVVIDADITVGSGDIESGLPVWDAANGGYMFTAYTITGVDSVVDAEAGTVQYQFAFFTMARARALIVDANLDDDLSIIVRITWTKGETTYYEDVHFGDTSVNDVVGQNGKIFAVTLSNYAGFESLAFQASVISGTNTVVHTEFKTATPASEQ